VPSALTASASRMREAGGRRCGIDSGGCRAWGCHEGGGNRDIPLQPSETECGAWGETSRGQVQPPTPCCASQRIPVRFAASSPGPMRRSVVDIPVRAPVPKHPPHSPPAPAPRPREREAEDI